MYTTENEVLESGETMCIPKPIFVAALLLIKWMQEQCQCENLDMAECRQPFVFDESLQQEQNFR